MMEQILKSRVTENSSDKKYTLDRIKQGGRPLQQVKGTEFIIPETKDSRVKAPEQTQGLNIRS